MNAQTERRAGIDRRDYSLSTLKMCTVAPRRMQGRRSADRKYAVLDRFDSGIVTLAILLMILSIMDSVFTLTLLSRGGSEVNPVMNALLHHSVWGFHRSQDAAYRGACNHTCGYRQFTVHGAFQSAFDTLCAGGLLPGSDRVRAYITVHKQLNFS